MHKTEFVEFHITETCNLTCSGCNRYNNLGLRGHEDWDKNKEHYKKFASFVEVKSADKTDEQVYGADERSKEYFEEKVPTLEQSTH